MKGPRVRDRQVADRALRKLLVDLDEGRVGIAQPAGTFTHVQPWADEYLENLERDKGDKGTTIRAYRSTLSFARPIIGDLELDENGQPELRLFVRSTRAGKRGGARRHRPQAPPPPEGSPTANGLRAGRVWSRRRPLIAVGWLERVEVRGPFQDGSGSWRHGARARPSGRANRGWGRTTSYTLATRPSGRRPRLSRCPRSPLRSRQPPSRSPSTRTTRPTTRPPDHSTRQAANGTSFPNGVHLEPPRHSFCLPGRRSRLGVKVSLRERRRSQVRETWDGSVWGPGQAGADAAGLV